MRIRFRVLNTELKGQEYVFDANCLTVGRSSDGDLVLDQRSVSRMHARVVQKGEQVCLEDLGSRNRTELDGLPVTESVALKPGSLVTFGEVTVEVSFPDGEGAEARPRAAETHDLAEAEAVGQPVGMRPLKRIPETWLAPARQAVARKEPEKAKYLEGVFWKVLVLVLALSACGLLTAYFLLWADGGPDPVARFGISVCVGQPKVVEVPEGFVHNPQVSPKGVLKVERPLNLDRAVLLEGTSEGVTTVTLHDKQGGIVQIHVRVLPLPEEKLSLMLAEQVRTEKERVALAEDLLKKAARLHALGDVYGAWQQYGRALILLEPFATRPTSQYLTAQRGYEETGERIEKKFEQLTQEMGDFIKTGDKLMALERLSRMKVLIQDEDDVRWQNADLLYRLLERAIEAEKKQERRRL